MASDAALDLIVNLKDNASKSLNAIAKSGGFLKDALSFATGGIIQKGVEAIGGTITNFFSDGISESQGWNSAMAQTEAVIKSTGGAAGLSAQQMGDLAASLSGANGVSLASDDAILAGENLLATFTNIGEKTFPRATSVMVDMAQAMGTDVKGGAIQLGKALNDPIAGIGALSRVGVTFTGDQKAMIKTMVEAGDTAGAQAVIMAELEKEFGGSAAAAAKADGGMFQLSEQMANVKQTVGDALLPIMHELAGFIASPAVMGALQGLAGLIAGALTGAFQGLKAIFEAIAPTVQTFVSILTQAFGSGVQLDTIQALPGWLQPIATLFGTLATNVSEFFGALQGGTDPLTAIGDLIQNNLVDMLTLLGLKQADVVAFLTGFKDILGQVGAFILDPVLPALGALAGWLGEQIPKVIQFEADVWANILLPALRAIWGFIQDPLLPILGEIAAWLGENIPKAIQAGADFWNNTLLPAMRASYQFSQEHLVPILNTLGQWLGENIPKALQAAADFWNNTLLPALTAAWAYFQNNILPILRDVAIWLSVNVPAALRTLANFWNNTLLPAITTAWNFFQNNILPVLRTVATTLTETVGTALSAMAGIWNTAVLPAITAVWQFFTTSILPLLQVLSDIITKVVNLALTAMAGIWQNVILPAITAVWNFISSKLQPIFESISGADGPVHATGNAFSQVALIWTTVLSPALSGLWNMVSSKLAPAFNTLKDAIGNVTSFLQTLSNGLDNIKLPDWMTPGSPTPWEIGLRGVIAAMQGVVGGPLPQLAGQLNTLTQGAATGGDAGPMTPLVDGMALFTQAVTALPAATQTGLATLPAIFAQVFTDMTATMLPHLDPSNAAGLLGMWGTTPTSLLSTMYGRLNGDNAAAFRPNVRLAMAGVLTDMGDAVDSGFPGITSAWSDNLLTMTTAMHTTADEIVSVGTLMMEGIAAGINAGTGFVVEAAQAAVAAAIAAAQAAAGIASPSKVMAAQVGLPLMEGAAVGVADGVSGLAAALHQGLRAAMPALASSPAPAFVPGSPGTAGSGGGSGGGPLQTNASAADGGITVWVMVPGLPYPVQGQATTQQSVALRWQQELGRLPV